VPATKLRRSALVIAFTGVLMLAACATGPKPSDVILARPVPPLLDTAVRFQRMLMSDDESGDELTVPVYDRRLVVTANELVMPGGNGNELTPWEFTLSFATVETVEIKDIEYEPFFPIVARKTIESAVVIKDKRGRCRRACVFVFADSNERTAQDAVERFAAIVRTGQATVDPFGRVDGPRPVAAAVGLRAPRPGWSVELRDADSETKKTAREIDEVAFDYTLDLLREDFRDCVIGSLNEMAAPCRSWARTRSRGCRKKSDRCVRVCQRPSRPNFSSSIIAAVELPC
jgi:hypothetical protein